MTIVATPVALPGDAAPVTSVGDMFMAFFTLAFSGNYPTGGDALDFLAAWPGGATPSSIVCVDANGFAGYGYEYVNSAVAANRKLKLFSSANTELLAAAYNAALTGDTNIIVQVFAK